MLKTTIHPGVHLQELLDELGVSQIALARHIGVRPNLINEVCRGRRRISPQLAEHLAVAFGSSVEFWLTLQMQYELGKAKSRPLHFGRLPEVKEGRAA